MINELLDLCQPVITTAAMSAAVGSAGENNWLVDKQTRNSLDIVRYCHIVICGLGSHVFGSLSLITQQCSLVGDILVKIEAISLTFFDSQQYSAVTQEHHTMPPTPHNTTPQHTNQHSTTPHQGTPPGWPNMVCRASSTQLSCQHYMEVACSLTLPTPCLAA